MIGLNEKNPTLEQLREFFAHREATTRQHGKKGKTCLTDEEEFKRLKNNYVSICSRAKRKEREEEIDRNFRKSIGSDDGDEYGIRPVDRRRYEAKFKNCPKGSRVELAYVRRMTGLSLFQIYHLQEETGLYPYPRVTEKDAKIDKKRREDAGITAIIDG